MIRNPFWRNVALAFVAIFVCLGADCQGPAQEIDKAAQKTKRAVSDAAGSTIEAISNAAETAGEAIDKYASPEMIRSVIPLLPPEYQGIAGWIAALGLGFRASHNRRSGRNIAKGINAARREGKVDFNDGNRTDELSRVMGSGGKRLVDEAQGKKISMPL